MMKKRFIPFVLSALVFIAGIPLASAVDYTFKDRNGDEVVVPENAFATSVISFEPGDPWTEIEANQNPQVVLGPPDYTDSNSGADLCLGAGGVLVLGFDIAIYDGEGNDIYVFEVGGDVEATKVEVSNDLSNWYEVGTAQGRTAGVDLNGKVPEESRFRYVRLTDLKEHTGSRWPGADIDAVSGLNVKPASSGWAQTEMDKAEEYGLIPDVLKNSDLTQSITRAEFAAVAVKTYENLAAAQALPATVNPFTDCNDIEVLKAYNIGAVNGTSPTTFSPNDLLNREQAAAMLTRVFKRSTIPGWTLANDADYSLTYTKPASFADDAYISTYARDSVYFMAANSIISGVGDNKFAPKNTTSAEEARGYANATREQALAIAVRMVENLK